LPFSSALTRKLPDAVFLMNATLTAPSDRSASRYLNPMEPTGDQFPVGRSKHWSPPGVSETRSVAPPLVTKLGLPVTVLLLAGSFTFQRIFRFVAPAGGFFTRRVFVGF